VDQLQVKFNNIGAALFNAYIFQPFMNLEDEIVVQQEMQQQQSRGNFAESPAPTLTPRLAACNLRTGNERAEA
jgi:hypothetical protein